VGTSVVPGLRCCRLVGCPHTTGRLNYDTTTPPAGAISRPSARGRCFLVPQTNGDASLIEPGCPWLPTGTVPPPACFCWMLESDDSNTVINTNLSIPLLSLMNSRTCHELGQRLDTTVIYRLWISCRLIPSPLQFSTSHDGNLQFYPADPNISGLQGLDHSLTQGIVGPL